MERTSVSILNHTHEWIKWKRRFGELFFRCAHPDCSKITEQSLLVGKRSTCAVCHIKTLVLTKEDLKRATPRCLDCSNTAAAKQLRETKQKVASVLDDLFAPKTETPTLEEEEQLS